MTHRTVWSLEPDTMVLPSMLRATLTTQPVCPTNVPVTSPDAKSHILEGIGRNQKVSEGIGRYRKVSEGNRRCGKACE